MAGTGRYLSMSRVRSMQIARLWAYNETMESKQYLVTLSVRNGHTVTTTQMIVSAESEKDAGDQAHESTMFLENRTAVVRVVQAVELFGGSARTSRTAKNFA